MRFWHYCVWPNVSFKRACSDYFVYTSREESGGSAVVHWPEADPRFLQWGFICIKVMGFALLLLSHF